MKKIFLPLLGMTLCFMLSSCVILSENPLSAPETARADQRLVGTWRGTSDSSHDDLFRFSITKGPWMHVTITPSNKKEKTDSYDFFPTILGKHTFLNVQMTGKDAQGHLTKAYFFIRYSISSDHILSMWTLSQEEIVEAIQKGKLKGIIHQDKNPMMIGHQPYPDDVTIQDTTANLVRFIKHKDIDDLFDDDDKMNSLERIGN